MSSKTPRTPVEVVRAFWERLEARDWNGARACLADGVVVVWPATLERFEGGDLFIAMNAAYPEGWHVSVQAVMAQKHDVLAWVAVTLDGQRSWCSQRATVHNKKIVNAVELWTDEGGVTAPTWRKPFASQPPVDQPAVDQPLVDPTDTPSEHSASIEEHS